jgi:hypothetical protein
MDEEAPLLREQEGSTGTESPPLSARGRTSFSTTGLFRVTVRKGAPDLVSVSLKCAFDAFWYLRL